MDGLSSFKLKKFIFVFYILCCQFSISIFMFFFQNEDILNKINSLYLDYRALCWQFVYAFICVLSLKIIVF